MLEPDAQVGGRHVGRAFARPFDQTQTTVGEVFVQARIDKFFRKIEPIEIKVI